MGSLENLDSLMNLHVFVERNPSRHQENMQVWIQNLWSDSANLCPTMPPFFLSPLSTIFQDT